MPLVNTRDMFKRAYEGGYAIGAFNVNNMEIIQGIMEGATAEKAPVILQVSAGARKYANHTYLMKLIEAALIETNLPIAVHLVANGAAEAGSGVHWSTPLNLDANIRVKGAETNQNRLREIEGTLLFVRA